MQKMLREYGLLGNFLVEPKNFKKPTSVVSFACIFRCIRAFEGEIDRKQHQYLCLHCLCNIRLMDDSC